MDNEKQILSELKSIRADLDYIKARVRDADTILTSEDIESLKVAEEDYKKGRIKRLV